jgi:transcriptional regulator NrdR family protein
MTCPTCQAQTRIIDTTPNGCETRRRHECRNGHRFATIETVVGIIASRVCERTGLFGYANKYYAMRKRRSKTVAAAAICTHCGKWHLTLRENSTKPENQI